MQASRSTCWMAGWYRLASAVGRCERLSTRSHPGSRYHRWQLADECGLESGKAGAQPLPCLDDLTSALDPTLVPFSSYTASGANSSFALLQSLSLYAVIPGLAISNA